MKKVHSLVIKIPEKVSFYYCNKTNFLLIKGFLGSRFIHLNLAVTLDLIDRTLTLNNSFIRSVNRNSKKNLSKYLVYLHKTLKTYIFEVSIFLIKKLKFVGLGYRFFLLKKKIDILLLKLGYSHNIYFKIPNNIKLNFFKNTILHLKSNNYFKLTQTLSTLRVLKQPEPYKGKGILYDNEVITLKKGKKI